MNTDYKVWIAIEKHTVDANGHESWNDVDCGAPSVGCETLAQARKVAEHMAEQGEQKQQELSSQAATRAYARKRQRNG